ncbi:hypothetical protein OR16_31619 [Cupriavidus basilensis OR16]|uniref:Uncharacterized protein n=1 Tax=Cupriavidus basilensis OR16 TaxID=1127483 RepID=H1SDL8_9BURK|nr:hypothetical protein [Cupriavidus basilensis]EHP39403.1 hypothetical protein OR16_31619 [Cupriavidus basilensis OR16]
MATAKKAVPMCIVSIGFQDYLLPAASGMKLVDIMTSAVECEKSGYLPVRVVIGEQPEVKLEMVKPQHIRQRAPRRDDELALENNPSPVLRLR